MLIKPQILPAGKYAASDVENFKQQSRIWEIRDIFPAQLEELFSVTHPGLLNTPEVDSACQEFVQQRLKDKAAGSWVYYPWSGCFVRIVDESDLDFLRFNRNHNLITAAEQTKLQQFSVGIAGLSIGNNIALNLVHTGLGKNLKLAEHDTLSTTNLNRLRTRLSQIGQEKIDITTQQIYEVDPYVSIKAFPAGLNTKNLKEFILGSPRLNVVIDAIDDFKMKVILRQAARDAGVPVLMLTNLGDTVLIDIERYDQEKSLPLFNGLIGHTPEEILSGPIGPDEVNKYAIQIVGRENVPPRALNSVKEIGRTLVGRPQLMSTVSIGAGLAAYLVRQLALGANLPSGRRKFEWPYK